MKPNLLLAASLFAMSIAAPALSADSDLVVLDSADLASLGSVRIHRHVPRGVHSTWIPSTRAENDPTTAECSPRLLHGNA